MLAAFELWCLMIMLCALVAVMKRINDVFVSILYGDDVITMNFNVECLMKVFINV